MYATLCVRFGLIAGSAVGFLVALLPGLDCCTTTAQPTVLQLAADGVLVALVTMVIATVYTCIVTRFPFWTVLALALFIGIVIGVLLGPLAYHTTHPALALIVCSYLGALLGWLICQIRCRTSTGNVIGAAR